MHGVSHRLLRLRLLLPPPPLLLLLPRLAGGTALAAQAAAQVAKEKGAEIIGLDVVAADTLDHVDSYHQVDLLDRAATLRGDFNTLACTSDDATEQASQQRATDLPLLLALKSSDSHRLH